ncbi:MAG: methyltransferase [Micropruina sp.]
MDELVTLAATAEVALRRRGDVHELIVNGVFAMDSLDSSSELALADAAGSPPGKVLVGGLGLGFTAQRLLANGATSLDVVELAEPLIAWARAGLTAELAEVAADPRVRLHHGDIVEWLGRAEGTWDAILLDVDNGPTFLIHDLNARVYAREFLLAAVQRLTPGGHLVIWCESASPELAATLGTLGSLREDVISVTRGRRVFDYVLYSCRPAASAAECTGSGGVA